IFIGFVAGKDVPGLTNTPPTGAVMLSNSSPLTNETLTATAVTSDGENNPVTLTYVWKVGNTVVKTTANTTALTDSLNLSIAGNGNRGDVITVEVTPNDGTVDGDKVTASATVGDSAPSATPQSASTLEDTPQSGTLAGADADGDSLTFALYG